MSPVLLPGVDGHTGIHEVLSSAAACVGAYGFSNTLNLPTAPRYVVFVVDGLGELLLRQHTDVAPWLSRLPAIENVIAGIPSTTSVSLTSLGTGIRPGRHGMVGYTSRVPGTMQLLNTLKWDQSVDPVSWQPHAAVLRRVSDQGISATVVNDSRFEFSGLTLCSQRGVPFIGVDRNWERLDAICDAVEQSDRAIVYAYESQLDHVGHGAGSTSSQWREVLAEIDRDIAQLRAELPSDTALIVTADHGMIDLPLTDRFDIAEHVDMLEDVVLVAGEARFRHLYTRTGAENKVAELWRERLGHQAQVMTRDQGSAWFGPIEPAVAPRFGDVMIAAAGEFAVFDSVNFAIELRLRGFHGSTSEAELRIPLLVAA